MPTKKIHSKQHSRKNCNNSTPIAKWNVKKRKKQKFSDNHNLFRLQDPVFSSDFILKMVFRKDGPPLGVEFESLPSHAFRLCKKDSRKSHRVCQENQRALKRRKVSKPAIMDYQICNQRSAPVKKHGIGKGLMTVWRVTNPDAGDFPTRIDFAKKAAFRKPVPISQKPPIQEKKKTPRRQQPKRLGNKLKDKKKPSVRSRKKCQKIEMPKQPRKERCELALEGRTCQEDPDQFSMLVDDEELELRELQAGPNPLTCSAHFATDRLHGCSLCKDLLAKFPPNSVAMKQPICMQPWDSSPELVKKMFKVFHFICTYAVTIDICPFNFDEFTQAFHDKDSLLLGKINVAMLKLLLADIEMELNSEFLSRLSKNCKFLGLLHSVECQDFVLKFWKRSLNSLTWTEILRQVLIAAGFGSQLTTSCGEVLSKELNLMAKYGICPGTLKGKLFTILSSQGNKGMKVSELAKSSPIVELNLASTTDELELLISLMLSSDITLFEKISSSAYRLRINYVAKESDNDESDSEGFGSVDDDSKDSSRYDSADDSVYDIVASSPTKCNRRNHHKSRNNMLTVYTEIDESHQGEVWLLGLMEGEYSELKIEEKLDALVALIDLRSAGSSIRKEDPATSLAECVPNANHIGSGAKIKRLTAKQDNLPRPYGSYNGQMLGINKVKTRSLLQPFDSLASISKISGQKKPSSRKKDAKEMEVEDDLHPMQSIFLGSDRRYNRYWLFLGPCNAYDPGHKRIYFESSEDGHWEVIDTEEALCTLLSALDRRGMREARLLSSIEKREVFLCRAMSSMPNGAGIRQPSQSDHSEQNISREDSSSAVSDVDNNRHLSEVQNDLPASAGAIVLQSGKKGEQQKQKWSRAQAFDTWTWNSFYSELNAVKHSKRSYLDSLARCECCHDLYWRDEKHCKICHTTFELDFDLEERYAIHSATCRESTDSDMFPKHKVLSSQLQSLKAAVYAVESVMPNEALLGGWTKSAHNLWVKRLRRTSTLAEFLQVLADFVGAIKEDWLHQCNFFLESNSVIEEIIGSFSTMPQTSCAVALWLVKLDTLIASHLESVQPENKKESSTRFKGKHMLVACR